MRKASLEYVASLERGLRVLQTFSRDHPAPTLSEMAALTHLSPATARRALHTLEALGYVGRLGRRFLLGPKALGIGAGYLSAINADIVLSPFLTDLVAHFGGGSSVTVLDGTEIICVALASVSRAERHAFATSVGSRLPADATAMGRVLLAFQPRAMLDAYFARTRRAIATLSDTTAEALRRILDDIRCLGFATTQDTCDGGLVSVAVPIAAPSGQVIAAAGCTDVADRYDADALVNERLARLRQAAARIEEALSRHPELVYSIVAGHFVQRRPRTRLSQPAAG